MKNIFLFQLLIFPLFQFSQIEIDTRLPNIFYYKNGELRDLVKTNKSLIKISNEEIEALTKIIDERKEEYFKIIDAMKKSIPRDANNRPTGKADSEQLKKMKAIDNEVSTSICELLGERRNRQFRRMLIDECDRKTMEKLKKAGKIN